MVEHKPQTEALSVDTRLMEPRLAVLFDYWSGLARSPALPRGGGAAGEGFRLVDVPADLLSILTVVDTGPAPEDYVYRFWGSGRFLFAGDRPDPTGRPVLDALIPVNARDVLAQYQEVCRTARPMLMQNTWVLDSGLIAECQTLRLPLAGDPDSAVGMVVAATKFIRHADEIRRLQEDDA